MINTIFYFADTENEYMDKYNKGEVSSRTIAFVKDSNKIFINGHDYIDRQSVIDQLVADAQLKDQDLANTIRQELAAAQATLESSISDANDYAEGVHDDLQGFKTEIAQDLSDSITAAITNANGRTIWTELATTNEGLTAATNRINVALDANGNVKYTSALQSVINTGIDNNTAFTDIASRYAVLGENQDIISWMTSGFKGHTNDTESFAAMYAAANEATQNAIAQVKTEVTTDAAGKYVAKAGLSTEVQNIVDEAVRTNSLSYVASKSDVSGAESRMGAQYTTLNNALGTTNTTLSEVKTTAEEGKARASLLTSAGPNGGYIINESTLESSMVSIFNKAGDASTFIQQKANAAKDSAVATATTLINTQASNVSATYATKTSLNDVNTTLASYLKDANGNIIKSASLQESIDENAANISLLASDLENGTAAGLVSKAGLDEAVNGLLASNSNAGTKSTIQQMANNAAASTDITARMKNALGVDALNKIAQKSYVTDEIGSATTSILSTVDTKIASAKAGLATEAYVNSGISTAKNNLKAEICDANGKPKGVADLEQTVSDKIGENGSITNAVTNLQTSVSTANTNASSALTQLALVDGKISTAISGLKAEICDSNGKPKGVASLEQTVSNKIGENGSITNAITDLQTSVSTANTNASSALTQLANVDSKISQASNNLEAKLTGENGTVTNALSSLEQTVKSYTDTEVGTVNTAVNNLSTSVNGSISTLSQNVSSNGSAIQSLLTSVSGINSSIATLTQDVSANASNITAMSSTVSDLQTNQSQFYTASNLDAAVAGLMANSSTSTGSKIATIEASTGVDFSTITLSADQINFEGSSTFQGAVNALDITAKNIKTTDANNVTTNEINSNGNGMLAKGGITWTVDGGLTLSQAFLQSLTTALSNGISAGGNAVKGYDVEVMMPGVPSNQYKYTVRDQRGNDYISTSISLSENAIENIFIYDYDSFRNAGCILSITNEFPVNGTLELKKLWVINSGYIQYKLSFISGILQNKTPYEGIAGIPVANLTESDINSRVLKIRPRTESEYIQQILSSDYTSAYSDYFSRLRGYYMADPVYEISNDIFNVSNPQHGDFLLCQKEGDFSPGISWKLYYWNNSVWTRLTANTYVCLTSEAEPYYN